MLKVSSFIEEHFKVFYAFRQNGCSGNMIQGIPRYSKLFIPEVPQVNIAQSHKSSKFSNQHENS